MFAGRDPVVRRQSRSGLGPLDGGRQGRWLAARFLGYDQRRGARSAWLRSSCGQRKGLPGNRNRRTDAAIDLLRSQVTARPAPPKPPPLQPGFQSQHLQCGSPSVSRPCYGTPAAGLGRGAEQQQFPNSMGASHFRGGGEPVPRARASAALGVPWVANAPSRLSMDRFRRGCRRIANGGCRASEREQQVHPEKWDAPELNHPVEGPCRFPYSLAGEVHEEAASCRRSNLDATAMRPIRG